MLQNSFDLETEMQPTAKKPLDNDKTTPKSTPDGSPSSAGNGENSKNKDSRKEETVTSILDRVDPDFPYELPI